MSGREGEPRDYWSSGDAAWELDQRLAQHFEEMNEALDHDRRFLLRPAWGIVNAASFLFAIIAAGWVPDKLGLDGWLGFAVGGVTFLAVLGGSALYNDRGLEGDERKLSRLPEWKTVRARPPR